MELHENRTELQQLLAAGWGSTEHRSRRKSSLPKWLFAVTLIGAVMGVFAPSNFVAFAGWLARVF